MNTTNLQSIVAVLLLAAILLQLHIIGRNKSRNISIGAESLKLNDETFRKAQHQTSELPKKQKDFMELGIPGSQSYSATDDRNIYIGYRALKNIPNGNTYDSIGLKDPNS